MKVKKSVSGGGPLMAKVDVRCAWGLYVPSQPHIYFCTQLI